MKFDASQRQPTVKMAGQRAATPPPQVTERPRKFELYFDV